MSPRIASACTIVVISAATLMACVDCPRAVGLNTEQCAALSKLELPAALPPSVGNAKADDERAALLGFSLFFDARLSRTQNVRCATCHVPERVFGDGRPTSLGLEPVERNSPSIYSAAWHRWQMWDGRADSLWSQAVLPFENAHEMDFTRLELAHRISASYRAEYEAVFGALPDLSDAVRFPSRGKPGDAAFDAMAAGDRLEVSRVAANAGKAIEAYERRTAYGRGRFDAFLAGDERALSAKEREGLAVFVKAKCDACHSGPTFSDDAFHATGVPPAEGKSPERARAAALEALATWEFSVSGPFHDGAPVEAAPAATSADEGAYRTPGLRNVARTGPWGHNGVFTTLEEAVDFELKLVKVTLPAGERDALLAFLRALDASDPPSPWNNWPDR